MTVFLPFLCGILLFYLFAWFPASTVVVFLTASIAAAYRRRFLLLLFIILGIGYAFFRFSPEQEAATLWNRELRLTGRFIPGKETSASGRDMRTFRPDSIIDEESGEELEAPDRETITLFDDFDPDYDSQYEILLRTGKDRSKMNPGGSQLIRPYGTLLSADQTGEPPFTVSARFDAYRDRLNRYLLNSFSPDSASLIISITTGKTEYLSDGLKNAFNATGLTHILSISGSHFGLFSVLLFGIFTFLIKRLPYAALVRLTVYTTPSEVAAVLTIPFMLFYLGLSGGSPPAVRSFVMIALFLAGLLIGRKGAWLNSLCFAGFLLALWDPAVILQLSFQLSFLAVLFIGYYAEQRKQDSTPEETPPEGSKVLRFLKYSLMLALVVTLGTAPLVAYHFHYASLISPVANLVASPLIGSILVALALLSSFSFLLTGVYLLKPLVGITADWSIKLVRLLAEIPHADISIPAFPPVLFIFLYAGLVLYLFFDKKRVLLLTSILPFVVYAVFTFFSKDAIRITFLDAGQGDSAVLQLPDKKTLVIDTGRSGWETAAFLKYLGIREITALALTHTHPDHCGGRDYIRERFRIKETWESGPAVDEEISAESAASGHRSLERGDIITGRGYEIALLHPYKEFYTLDGNDFVAENNASLVLKIKGEKHSFLLAGDIEEEAEENLTHLGNWLKSDVIKIPHHGGRTSANPQFLAAVSPSIAVISVGRENTFGHPSPEMLEQLQNIRVLRTDLDGAIKITETAAGLQVKTYKDYAFERADSLPKEWENIRRLFETW
ncbi:MAG: DNA internalization-related competence protein ComEC/Rec2 [Thermodesulfovibrio sp.]|nr:DNA internalization-related competence protein ComEC/Rec2 [Thermodesulfovibrio sp.]